MDNLNKEDFWDLMYQKYPLAMIDFCNWIDEYKKKNNWNTLFYEGLTMGTFPDDSISYKKAPKFHDLPIAMQMGIWNEYLDNDTSEIRTCKKGIESFLYAMQEGIDERNSLDNKKIK